jgi:hypothetical protein
LSGSTGTLVGRGAHGELPSHAAIGDASKRAWRCSPQHGSSLTGNWVCRNPRATQAAYPSLPEEKPPPRVGQGWTSPPNGGFAPLLPPCDLPHEFSRPPPGSTL